MANQTHAMPDDRWLDDALRGGGDYLDDAGFTARVMDALPPAAEAAPRWRKPAVMVLWALAAVGAAVAMPGALLDVTRETYRLIAAQPVSLPQIATAVVAFATASWSAAAYALRSSE